VFVAEGHGTPIEVTPGGAAFAPDDAGPITLAGTGTAFVAAVPR
jgi:mannose-6-phosphate isomerase